MSKKKATTSNTSNTSSNYSNTSTNTFGQIRPEDTPDIEGYRGWRPEGDPSIPYRFARARTKLGESFDNPMGQYTTPAIREATQRAAEGDLMQQEGQAMRESQFDVNNQRGGQLATLAALTAPRIVQTGGTSSGTGTSTGSGTGTSVQTGGWLEPLLYGLGSGAGGAGGALA